MPLFHRGALARQLVAAAAAFTLAHAAQAGAIITFGATSLGVNDTAELNFDGVGLNRTPIGDAIIPGCPCEGWGVSLTQGANTFATFANQSTGSDGFSTAPMANSFGSTANTATSQVTMADLPVTVRHAFGPSLVSDVFQVQVTITNTGNSSLNDLVYRRAMDWDVPPTPFREYVTHNGVVANLEINGGNVRYAGNNGFASSDPRTSAAWDVDGDNSLQPTFAGGTVNTTNTNFVKAGSSDHGSVFDFAFGHLAAGQTRVFSIYYGSAENEASALSKLGALGVNVYSLGQSSDPGLIGEEGGGEGEETASGIEVLAAPMAATPGFNPGDQPTFLFGFGGVGGSELGSTQTNPVLPFVPAQGQYFFDAPVSGRWFDPPFASGYTIAVTGADVTLIEAPVGFENMTVTVDGVVVDSDFDGGERLSFATGVRSFVISFAAGRVVDTADAAPFPLYMEFGGTASSMSWTATLAPVPEAGTLGLMLAGIAAMAGITSRRRQAA